MFTEDMEDHNKEFHVVIESEYYHKKFFSNKKEQH